MGTICRSCGRRIALGEPGFIPGGPCMQCRQRQAMANVQEAVQANTQESMKEKMARLRAMRKS